MKPSELDVDRWRRIDEVFDAALDRAPEERDHFLEHACQGDPDLRAEVVALLGAHALGESVLSEPAGLLGASLIAEWEGPTGRDIGPFRVIREIGRGGMGVVYLAEDTRVGRYVALKVLPPYLGVGRDARRRFGAEARAVSRLDHPNIATLYETDETEDGQLYMAFAFYDGETLAERIGRGAVPHREAVEIAIRVARGLAVAHENGIIHRDVKPSNVLLTVSGEVKLLDFGVAKGTGGDLTGEGIRPGTVAYMSPEHVRGRTLDVRADLWSLGVVVSEMLTGERPFQGDDPAALLHSIVHDAPEPLADLDGERTEGLRRIVSKLLAKRPEDRYGSARELIEDLQALQEGKPPMVAIRAPPRPATAETDHGSRPGRRRFGRRERAVAASVFVLAVAGAWAAYGLWPDDATNAGVSDPVESLAVLPLRNLTGEASQEAFVDGVHEAFISELGALGTLRVLSRSSVRRYRDTDRSIPEIADELGVDAVVRGTVDRDGDSLRVTARLVAASPERQLWIRRWRGEVGAVFEIAADMARSVAAETQTGLTPGAETRLASSQEVDPDAYDAYTLGMFSLQQRSAEGFRLAENYFRRAMEISPDFAPAYAALAGAYGSAAFFGLRRPSESMPSVRALADTAVRMDSTLAEAHVTMAAVALYWDWDWETAERRAREAIALNPSLPEARNLLGEVLSVRGRLSDALASVRLGSDLQRFVPFAAFRPAVVLLYMRHFDRAASELREGLRFFPDFWQGHWLSCQAHSGRGSRSDAVSACEEAVQRSGRTPLALGALGHVYALDGRRSAAEEVVGELEAGAAQAYVAPSSVAIVHGALGDLDRAFAWMERAYEERDVQLVHLDHYTFFDPLRSDPRFDDLRARVGLESRPTPAIRESVRSGG